MMDYRDEAPEILRDFLAYHETVKGHSRKTVDEYYLDLRNFFRFLKIEKGLAPRASELDDISISDVDLDFVRSVTLMNVYAYLTYLARDRSTQPNVENSPAGINAASRARKISSLRSFFKYLTVKTHQLSENPVADLDSPKILKALPRYLTLEESLQLLSSVDGQNRERDYCILTLFLNCGLRISELVGLDLGDIRADRLRVLGKGGKDRTVYLNEACLHAIAGYLPIRNAMVPPGENALFVTTRRGRIGKSAVHALVKKHIGEAGLDETRYSAHKLRHTAATLMLHNGVDIRTLQELLGHEHLNTTEIYTHVEDSGLRRAAELSPLANVLPPAPEEKPKGES